MRNGAEPPTGAPAADTTDDAGACVSWEGAGVSVADGSAARAAEPANRMKVIEAAPPRTSTAFLRSPTSALTRRLALRIARHCVRRCGSRSPIQRNRGRAFLV